MEAPSPLNILPQNPVYFSTASSALGSLGSSEEILSTIEERQRRLLEADDSTAETPAQREKRH